MKAFRLLSFSLALLFTEQAQAVNPLQHHENSNTLPTIGDLYQLARPTLLANGWQPVPAKCSYDNICFEYAELATPAVGATCGLFTRDGDTLRVCVSGGVADALPIASVNVVHAPAGGH